MSLVSSRHAIRAAMMRGDGATLLVSSDSPRTKDLVALARRKHVQVRRVSIAWMKEHAGPDARGVALEVAQQSVSRSTYDLGAWLASEDQSAPSLVVVLDHITDPQNVGAIFRSALLFEVDLLVMPSRRSGGGESIARASAGAAGHVPTAYVGNVRAAIEELKRAGFWVYAAASHGTGVSQVALHHRAVLVLGAEGKGVSPLVERASDVVVSIPATGGLDAGVDSLNVSVAAGILLYEHRRQAAGKKPIE